MLADRIGSSELAEMSARQASMAGSLRAGELPRLAAEILRRRDAPDAPLEVQVEFRRGPESLPVIGIRVSGSVFLTCQRCLGPVAWPLDLDVALTAVHSEEAANGLADPFDSVVLDEEGGLRLATAIEDEILATLPLAPRHEDPAACGPAAASAPEAARPGATRPFANLGELLRRDDGRQDRNR